MLFGYVPIEPEVTDELFGCSFSVVRSCYIMTWRSNCWREKEKSGKFVLDAILSRMFVLCQLSVHYMEAVAMG